MAQVKFSYKGLKIKNKNFCNEDFNISSTQYVCSEVGSYMPHDYGNQGDNTAGSVFDFFYIDAIGMENVELLGYGFLTPFTMIVASSFIAPSQKMNTGKVVAVLIFLFIVYSNMIGVSDTQPSFWEAIRIHEGLGKLYPIVLLALQSCGIYMGLTKNQEIQNYIKMRYNRE